MSLVCDDAILRDANGYLLQAHLDAEEIAALEWLAERGEVHRFLKTRKKRKIAVFRFLPPPQPPVEPSSSKVTDCSLTDVDIRQLACGAFTRRRFERWTGWGLLKGKGQNQVQAGEPRGIATPRVTRGLCASALAGPR